MKTLHVTVLWLLIMSTLAAPAYPDQQAQTCTVRGNVVWEYNKFVGTRPDVGAKVFLLRRFSDKILVSPLLRESDPPKGVYVTTVDLLGKFEFTGLPPGTYDLLIRSKNTTRKFTIEFNPAFDYEAWYKQDSEEMRDRIEAGMKAGLSTGESAIQIATRDRNPLDKIQKLNYFMFKKEILEPHFRPEEYSKAALLLLGTEKYKVDSFELKAGDTKELFVDFGNTYI